MIAWSPSTDDSSGLGVPAVFKSPSRVSEMPASRLPIIGYPLDQTPHEGVLGAALQSVGSQIQVEPWERRPHQLAEALAEVRSGEDFAGALIASPHKEK